MVVIFFRCSLLLASSLLQFHDPLMCVSRLLWFSVSVWFLHQVYLSYCHLPLLLCISLIEPYNFSLVLLLVDS